MNGDHKKYSPIEFLRESLTFSQFIPTPPHISIVQTEQFQKYQNNQLFYFNQKNIVTYGQIIQPSIINTKPFLINNEYVYSGTTFLNYMQYHINNIDTKNTTKNIQNHEFSILKRIYVNNPVLTTNTLELDLYVYKYPSLSLSFMPKILPDIHQKAIINMNIVGNTRMYNVATKHFLQLIDNKLNQNNRTNVRIQLTKENAHLICGTDKGVKPHHGKITTFCNMRKALAKERDNIKQEMLQCLNVEVLYRFHIKNKVKDLTNKFNESVQELQEEKEQKLVNIKQELSTANKLVGEKIKNQ